MTSLRLTSRQMPGLTFSRVWSSLAVTLKTIHEAIVVAKTRRMKCELALHGDLDEAWLEPDKPLDESDIRKIPQRPLIHRDQWDF
jgi:hypothetical protein